MDSAATWVVRTASTMLDRVQTRREQESKNTKCNITQLNLGEGIRAGLEDDEKDANGDGDLLQKKAVRHLSGSDMSHLYQITKHNNRKALSIDKQVRERGGEHAELKEREGPLSCAVRGRAARRRTWRSGSGPPQGRPAWLR